MEWHVYLRSVMSVKYHYNTPTQPLGLVYNMDYHNLINVSRGRHGSDWMVVGFTTTYAICEYHHWCCGLESQSGRGVHHYVIKFVSILRQVGGFLRVLRFPPPIKLSATIYHQTNKKPKQSKIVTVSPNILKPIINTKNIFMSVDYLVCNFNRTRSATLKCSIIGRLIAYKRPRIILNTISTVTKHTRL